LQYNLNQNLNQNLNLKGNLMSLKSQPEYTTTPEFEPLEDDIFASTQPAQGPEVIPPPNTAVGAVRPKLIKAFHDKELAIPIEDVRQWFHGVAGNHVSFRWLQTQRQRQHRQVVCVSD
jgi:hypothetical protein